MKNRAHVVVIGAGIGGLTSAALLAQAGLRVTVLEANTYPGGCAGTYYHKGYRFEAGATLAGGFQLGGPHAILGDRLGIEWPVRPAHPAWVVHLPDREIVLGDDHAGILAQFPESAPFWVDQARAADMSWRMAARGVPWPPANLVEALRLARIGLAHFPKNAPLARLAFSTVRDWLDQYNLATNPAFLRLIDGMLLISAQTTSSQANALYSAAALDLPRQGVVHVENGIGGLAHVLVEAIRRFGGEVRYKHIVTRIDVEQGRAVGVRIQHGRRVGKSLDCDFVIANVTPWSLDALLGEDSPGRLRREVRRRAPGWGAFVLYLGVDAGKLPANLSGQHQIITSMDGPLGEGRSIFVSMSPEWDASRAPEGHRAVTVTTHTAIHPWWELAEHAPDAYAERKARYTERLLDGIESAIPGFRSSLALVMPGTPVTYQAWTHRHRGMVGGFPQTSLFKVRGPRTGLPNVRLVGDSIFPGQSTAGVTVGAMRVVDDVLRAIPHCAPSGLISPRPTEVR